MDIVIYSSIATGVESRLAISFVNQDWVSAAHGRERERDPQKLMDWTGAGAGWCPRPRPRDRVEPIISVSDHISPVVFGWTI